MDSTTKTDNPPGAPRRQLLLRAKKPIAMSWNTWNSQDFPLVDKDFPLNAPFRAPSRDGAFAFFLRPSESIYAQLLQNDALFPGADTHAAKAPRKRGEKTHKRRGLSFKTREEMNKNGELIPQYRLRFAQPPNNCKFSSAHSAPSSRFFTNRPHLSTRNGTK